MCATVRKKYRGAKISGRSLFIIAALNILLQFSLTMRNAEGQELTVTITPTVIRTYYADSFTLPVQLNVSGGVPPYTYEWTYQCWAEPPYGLGEGDGNGGFTMDNSLTFGGGGQLLASVTDSMSRQVVTGLDIIVGSHLELVQGLGNVTVREGQSVVLGPVESSYGLGAVTITWWHRIGSSKGLVPVSDEDGNPALLTLGPVLPIHAGEYVARISDEGSTVTGIADVLTTSGTLTVETHQMPVVGSAGLVLLFAGIAFLVWSRPVRKSGSPT